MKKYTAVISMLIAFLIVFTSCSDKKADYVYDGTANIDFTGSDDSDTDSTDRNGFLVSYTYPDNPAEELRDYLKSDAKACDLPLEIGDIGRVEGSWQDKIEFTIHFTNDNNACVVSFSVKSENANDDYYSLDGKDNPSFTLAFKDSENSQAMITVLTLVIRYISPDLSLDEAKELAVKQDETISTDGYAMPQDLGGYHIQARYTNPYAFVSTQEFDAKLGVKVTALKQIWGEIDALECQELKSLQDYRVLTSEYAPWEDDYQNKTVYADFIVRNVWQHVEWVHGDFWVTVDVESMTGQHYTLRVETMRMFMDYEFGVGQQYTLYIYTGSNYGAMIVYAIQRSASTQLNSRGESQPLDYPNQGWDDRVVRVEPEGEGTVYNVSFELQCPYGELFAALEGQGIGEKQWPNNPSREGYEFDGWYDNLEWDGSPYTKDTPIYQDTTLYAKWKYTGPGGYWPRPHHGAIHGIEEGDSFSMNQIISFTAEGYSMNLVAPQDQRFRWIPLHWKVTDSISGDFTADNLYSAEFSVGVQGEYTLYITYKEEIFDGLTWQETGQIRDVEEVSFQVKN